MNEDARETETEVRTFKATESDAGERLDVYLSRTCPDLSRNQIQNAIQAGRAMVDGKPRSKGYRLAADTHILFQPLPPSPLTATPEDLPLSIVYEDKELLVVNKPAGMVVHPGPGHPTGTLVNALLHHCTRLGEVADKLRPGIVHRLDQDTSGLLAVALSDAAHRALAGQLKARSMVRAYQLLSWGRWRELTGELTGAIGRHPRDRQRMAVLVQGGRPAVTYYAVQEDFGFVQLCRVKLATGRTHQIRVHFAHAGHPVVGDPLYGDDRRARNVRPVDRPLAARMMSKVRRQMLHAATLTLAHPRSGQPLTFTAPIPSDMAGVLAELRSETPDHEAGGSA